MKQKKINLNGKELTIESIISAIADPGQKIELDKKSLSKISASHNFLKKILEANNKIIYGVNTGFGPMASYILAHGQIQELQENLILSHAVGMGEKINDNFSLAAMIVRLNTLAQGHSAVSPELLDQLTKFINMRIIPVIPEHGSVGTSGDLVQLAHIALALMGKGEVSYKNKIQKTSDVLRILKIKPYKLKSTREGLALINGTSMMTGIASLVCSQSQNLFSLAIKNGCLALELVKAYDDSFSDKLHELRPHPGQIAVAKTIKKLLYGSKLIRSRASLHKNANHGSTVHHINDAVQEFYSMRCIAQILGPVIETLDKTCQTAEIEMNSVTDNPILDLENQKFLHGGNFHGDYIAVSMDQLKAGLVKLTMLSERRLNFFLNNKINQLFPPFLNLDTPGLTLGLQGLQFVATSTTANSQTLAFPMSVHSISTNGDNQDVVSMGTDAALLTSRVLDNAFLVMSIESLALCQAVDYLKVQDQLSQSSHNLYNFTRKHVKKITKDRHLQPELQNLLNEFKKWPELKIKIQ